MSLKDFEALSGLLMLGSLGSVVLGVVSYMGQDVWLASTQWMLLAVVFGVYAVYLKLND